MTTVVASPTAAQRLAIGIPQFCFLLASVTVIIGMALGLYMGAIKDHQLMPVHAHLNVIGWLSMFMVGLFYKAHPGTRGLLPTLQVSTMAAGYSVMTGALAVLLLKGGIAFLVGAFAGAITLLISMIMFLVVVSSTVREQ